MASKQVRSNSKQVLFSELSIQGKMQPENGTNQSSEALPESFSYQSVTAVLNYCKTKILKPYLRLLSTVGLRPLFSESHEPAFVFQFINYGYIGLVMLLMIIGYVLQYMSCFRRDRGFCYENQNSGDDFRLKSEIKALQEQICQASLVFSFIVPSFLHLFGYLYSIVVFCNSEDDQLHILMERVFLSSTNVASGSAGQRRLIRILWSVVSVTLIWMLLSVTSINVMMFSGKITFKWVNDSPQNLIVALKILLVMCILCHDIVLVTIISNYCLQTQLLTSYLQFLREKLLQNPVLPLEWMRDIEEFKKMLNYINKEIAPSVCIFTVMNLSWGISGILRLFNYDQIEKETLSHIGISIVNVTLWIFIALAPFLQAARLSNACEILRNAGQEVRIRPFVHQDTPGYELDSILLYTISLKLYAKLFYVPVTLKYLCLFITFCVVCILVLGQCHYLI